MKKKGPFIRVSDLGLKLIGILLKEETPRVRQRFIQTYITKKPTIKDKRRPNNVSSFSAQTHKAGKDKLKSRKQFLIKGKDLLGNKKSNCWSRFGKYIGYTRIKRKYPKTLRRHPNTLKILIRSWKVKDRKCFTQFTRIHFQTFIDVDYTNESTVVPESKAFNS